MRRVFKNYPRSSNWTEQPNEQKRTIFKSFLSIKTVVSVANLKIAAREVRPTRNPLIVRAGRNSLRDYGMTDLVTELTGLRATESVGLRADEFADRAGLQRLQLDAAGVPLPLVVPLVRGRAGLRA